MVGGAECADENVEDLVERDEYAPIPANQVAGSDAQSNASGERGIMAEAADQLDDKVEEAGEQTEIYSCRNKPLSQNSWRSVECKRFPKIKVARYLQGGVTRQTTLCHPDDNMVTYLCREISW